MNKELQDHVWKHCLPKEFKEEVKKMYKYYKKVSKEEKGLTFECGVEFALSELFDTDNLTSDAEGEEILTIPRSVIQEVYRRAKRDRDKENVSSSDKDCYDSNILKGLFGSKCLPDENKPQPQFHKGDEVKVITNVWNNIFTVLDIKEEDGGFYYRLSCSPDSWYAESTLKLNEDNFAKSDGDNLSTESKPADPKFKPNDKVIFENVVCTIMQVCHKDYTYSLMEDKTGAFVAWIDESDLEPYTEPTEKKIENPDNLNFDKSTETFTDECQSPCKSRERLHVASMAMHALVMRDGEFDGLGRGYWNSPGALAREALRYADALIAECEKAMDYSNNAS